MDLRLLDRDRQATHDTALRTKGEAGDDAPLLCAACGATITHQRSSIEVGGASEHTFVNPAGIIYRIRCFGEAPGCREVGALTTQYSWFTGFAWRYAFCAACAEHLGWVYTAADEEAFFGLIAEKLVS